MDLAKGALSQRDYLNGTDIEGSKPRNLYKYETYNKNEQLLRDSVLGKKKAIQKSSDPLDPTYVMKSPSGRRMI